QPGKQGVFRHRLWCKLGINARRAKREKLFHSGFERSLNDVYRDREVVGNKVRRISIVRMDSPDMTGREKYRIRGCLLQPALRFCLPRQVEMLTIDSQDFAFFCDETSNDRRTCHALVASDKDALAFKVVQERRGHKFVSRSRQPISLR